ncbi:hypothetical protein [Helicobacter cynogastricus]|uniref:hypothetical protein n=1 Tax=Helicobacter cynogastricus TaxID=329937 RepID=UPI000CF124B0|nr:hypothetical protein [Helicobacter cynogastricus]
MIADLLLGIYQSSEISVSYKEALFYFSTPNYLADRLFLQALHALVDFSSAWISKDIALRLPNLLLHVLNVFLIYLLSCRLQSKYPYDPLLSALTFALLPGVQLGTILLGKVSLLLNMALWAILVFNTRYFYALVVLFAWGDSSCMVLLSAFLLHTLKHKSYQKALIISVALLFNLLYFKPIFGMPQGFFLNTIFVMLLLYSPCLCLYYPYALYTQVVKKHRQDSLIGLVGATGFCLPLILSLRQELYAQFLAYGMLGIPILLKQALSSIRVHLPIFRTHYRIRYSLIFGTLILESFFLWGGYNPMVRTHFIVKELATTLQERGIKEIRTFSPKMALRLRFYDIKEGGRIFLIESNKPADINISYKHKIVASYTLVYKP